MGVPGKDAKGLTPSQREAATLEATEGLTPTELAGRMDVTKSTISTWRRRAAYREHRERIRLEVEEKAVDITAELLNRAQEGLMLGLKHAEKVIREGGPDALAACRLMLDVYKVTSAQVGVVERVSVEVSSPEKALRLLREDLAGMSNEQLDAILKRQSTRTGDDASDGPRQQRRSM